MRLDEIRSTVSQSVEENWHLLPTDAATYVHRFDYGSDSDGRRIWGLLEHHTRAVLKSDVDVGLVWGMTLAEGLEFDWAQQFEVVEHKTTETALVEVLYRGQPVDRVSYVFVDNHHGMMPLPGYTYTDGVESNGIIDEWELDLVSLVASLNGGATFRTPRQYVERTGFDIGWTVDR